MTTQCQLDEVTLLDYITHTASPDVIAAVEGSPACKQAAQQLADEMMPLLSKLSRISCPEPSKLIDYQEDNLKGTEYLVVNKHVTDCARCQADLLRIEAAIQVPFDDEPGVIENIRRRIPELLRNFVEAVAVRPMLPTLRGESQWRGTSAEMRNENLHYETPQLVIELIASANKIPGKPPTWTLSGEMYTRENEPFTEAEKIVVRLLDTTEPVEYQTIVEGSSFTCEGIEAGSYNIKILTPAEKIVIRQYLVGNEE